MNEPGDIGVPFADGNMTPVLRFGDRVRRERLDRIGNGQAILRHLEEVGYHGAPRLLDTDNRYEWLTFVSGETVPPDLAGYTDDATLRRVVTEVRHLHSALGSFHVSLTANWPVMPLTPPGSTICHNDLSPWNTVFDGREFRAFLDWDLVGIGPRLWDLAWVAMWWVPLWGSEDREAMERRGRRLRLVLDTFGATACERASFLALIRRRSECGYATVETWGSEGRPGWEKLRREEHHLGSGESIAWLDRHTALLADHLVDR